LTFTLISPVEVDYIIVGAGASGIAAASTLMQYGVHSLVILEAENRIGGRINTVPFGMIILQYTLCHSHFL
jgi:cation diffusion facilitator CzcD-associated flavoprotein CzcO